MNYYSLLITLGIVVTLIPNLGFPGSWKTGMLSLLGICIALLAYFAKRALPRDEVEEDVLSVLPEPAAPQSRAALDVEVHHADVVHAAPQTHPLHTVHGHVHEEHMHDAADMPQRHTGDDHNLHHIYTPHDRRSHHA